MRNRMNMQFLIRIFAPKRRKYVLYVQTKIVNTILLAQASAKNASPWRRLWHLMEL